MAGLAPLQLPDGRSMQVAGETRDLSVLAHLRYTGGDWEPHVRALFERLIQPEWTCLDIGANIGAHTLTMAALATRGRSVSLRSIIRTDVPMIPGQFEQRRCGGTSCRRPSEQSRASLATRRTARYVHEDGAQEHDPRLAWPTARER